jgi:opacity protein-like surface antigen
MRLKLYHVPSMAVLFVCAACSTLAQTVPAATQNKNHFALGAGVSGYNPEADEPGHILGGTLWIDYKLPYMPRILNGLGMEAEARDLNYGRSNSNVPNLRMDTAEGGVIYSWPRYRSLRPYGKFLVGYGNLDQGVWEAGIYERYHDSRTIYIPGAGVDYQVAHRLWVRADYEFQWWPDMVHRQIAGGMWVPAGSRYPQGITLGVMYHF